MIGLNDFQDILANTFLDGNMELAGVLMFIGAIALVFAVTEKTFLALIIGMGVVLFFSMLGVLSTEITVLMIVVSVLGLAYSSRNVWRD